jgi:hypothetical protein
MTNPATASRCPNREIANSQPNRPALQEPEPPAPPPKMLRHAFIPQDKARPNRRRRQPQRPTPWASPLHHVKDPEDRCQITDIARHRPLGKVTNQCHKPIAPDRPGWPGRGPPAFGAAACARSASEGWWS